MLKQGGYATGMVGELVRRMGERLRAHKDALARVVCIEVGKGIEEARGEWTVVDRLLPFKTLPGRNYPVVVSFLEDGDHPGASSLAPDAVAEILAPAFAGVGRN